MVLFIPFHLCACFCSYLFFPFSFHLLWVRTAFHSNCASLILFFDFFSFAALRYPLYEIEYILSALVFIYLIFSSNLALISFSSYEILLFLLHSFCHNIINFNCSLKHIYLMCNFYSFFCNGYRALVAM